MAPYLAFDEVKFGKHTEPSSSPVLHAHENTCGMPALDSSCLCLPCLQGASSRTTLTHTIDSSKLEECGCRCRMMYAACALFFGLAWGRSCPNCLVSTVVSRRLNSCRDIFAHKPWHGFQGGACVRHLQDGLVKKGSCKYEPGLGSYSRLLIVNMAVSIRLGSFLWAFSNYNSTTWGLYVYEGP